MMEPLQKNEILTRGLFMLFFTVIYGISKFLIIGIIFFQFATIILTEKPNEQILKFSRSLGGYIFQIIRYLSFNSEQRPFPFHNWPDSEQYNNDDKSLEQ